MRCFLLWFTISGITCVAQPEQPSKRAHHEIFYNDETKAVYLAGGSTPEDGGSSTRFFNDLWQLNDGKWIKVAEGGRKYSGFKVAFNTKEKRLYSLGGFSEDNKTHGDLRVLNAKGEWELIAANDETAVSEPGFVYDAHRDRMVSFGGSPGQGSVNGTTREWDGKSWQLFEGVQPEGRQAFGMVYDSQRKRTILYGGINGKGELFRDGIWEYDGKVWKNIGAQNGPGPRMAFGYTYDSKRGQMIIYGGAGVDGMKGDTWAWNGKEWTKLNEEGPAARMMGYLTYDIHNDRVVLFGGRLSWPNDSNETWQWDGRSWTKL